MRFATATTILVIALVAMGAGSPRSSLAADANRMADGEPLRLAQNDSQNLYALWQQIQTLEQQVRQLRGKNQMLEHQIKRNRENRKRMYEDLDERIAALEGGGDNAGADDEAAEQAYRAAFNELRDNKYAEAVSGFEAFVEQYPDSAYSDNAWYWLGQARYVQGDLSGALEALNTLMEQFPDSDKLSSALYRIGVIEQAQGNNDKARAAFGKVISDYADSNSADRARKKLQEMGG